ncbi:MFS transporter [Bdellovibrio bacteriovorus]|uniref:MFS transporter n=1 Tax=Bdellovibrio bacteriovorus TaxID=959 RepID=A0A1Z3N487_BDEBC|nr:MFS transporter [Bdellovibrio bacteriovorus]ASD62292.1 MFS transporter [Bdellovibrio bacteriovorus]
MKTDTVHPTLTRGLVLLLMAAVGIIVANLYYAQPITAMISQALGLDPSAAGLVVTLTQIGYGLGVLLIVPLGDIIENRRLVLTMIGIAVLGVLGLAFASQLTPYFIAAFATGLGASTVQILVPYTAHFAPEVKRGQVVGSLMSGLMIGIMLSRPVSSLLTDLFSWHAVFVLSAALMTVLAIILYKVMPERHPENKNIHYFDLLKSMGRLFVETPVVRRRGAYQAFMFGAFCLFWTASPLLLAGPKFNLSQSAIAIFALVGVSGAVIAPIAGKAADKGHSRIATMIAMTVSAFSFLLSHFFDGGSTASLAALVISAILLDAGITANLVMGQRAIFSLNAEYRSRLNGLFIATIFVGGAVGSTLGAWAYARGGWELTSWVGFLMPALAFAYFLTEKKS